MMKPNLIYIYIDDEHHCPKEIQDAYVVLTARDYYGAIDIIKFCLSNNTAMYIDFSHDLGGGKTGYDVAKYIVENQIPIEGYATHSMSPIEVFNIHQLMSYYGYGWFKV